MSNATTLDGSFVGGGPPARGNRVYLVVREGGSTRVVDIDDGAAVVFGRSSSATVQVEDQKASREHARFSRRGDVVELVDLDSRNGTQLNGAMVQNGASRVRSGDLVRIGKVEILVAETAGVTDPAAGWRLDGAVDEMLRERGAAAIVRLSASAEEIARLQSVLGGAALVERQAAGEYACLVEDAARAAELVAAIARVAPKAVASVDEKKPRPAALPPLPGVIVGDPAMVRVFERVRKVAAAPTTVLVLGETGVGKEVIAEQLHRLSPRAGGPFMRLNCGSLPETLLESELFGHEKGAFTGADRMKRGYVEAANGGTLFLDEIGELALAMQTRLLRVLENHRFTRVGGREELTADIRVVAATNRDLEAETKSGRFRQDLYFRLSAFVIRVPPLRERAAELELLAELFVRNFARKMNQSPPAIAPPAMQLIRRYAWPGNVRELRNAMEHAVVVAEGDGIGVDALPDAVRAGGQGPGPSGPMREQIAELERRHIQEALDAEGGNQTRAAKRLGISRRALQYKLEKYDIKS